MKLLYGNDDEVAAFVAHRLEQDPAAIFRNCRAVGVVDAAGELVGGMVFHNWWPDAGTIEFSGAATTARWLTPKILDRLFGYAFEVAGVQLLVTRNSGLNHRVHRQLGRYGFTRIDIPRLYGRDEDGVIWTLTQEAYQAGRFHGWNVQKAGRAQAA